MKLLNIALEAPVALVSKMDEFGRPAWIVAIVASFWLWWPLGLAMLVYLAVSGRMRAWKMERRGRWQNPITNGFGAGRFSYTPPSGNHVFDEYRADTLRRLEDEQKEFVEYLERLRQARDKAEFDQFMAERRNRQAPAPTDV